MDGAVLEAGDELTEGSVNPHDILKIKGVRAVQDYMLREVQRVYRLQGVEINDKHIELIVRQMLQKVRVETNGDSDMLPGTLVDTLDFEDTNENCLRVKEKNWQKANRYYLVLPSFLSYELLLISSFLPGDNKSSDGSSYQRKS